MKRIPRLLPVFLLVGVSLPCRTKCATPPDAISEADQRLAAYLRSETTMLGRRCLADIHSLEDWQARRSECRRQLQEMLGLWPMPERTDLQPVIAGKIEREEFTVEKLYFQALPKLYVTANLYLPKKNEKPAPAILYVCGHSRVFTNGVSCGNKAYYQHHGEWFARNGYVCLVIDTLQFGEIEGLHHGTYREGQWWWNSRGYSPAGVEAWFGIRALDYLCSRQEVDKERIGMTGRSGGGSYTWTIAALDERVKVAAPVAGMTDLQNQVVDGAVEGHCDCMFFVNTYRWDFPQVAALIAPRPLLIANSDKDSIFPLDGVVRLYNQARGIYQLYGQTNHLGLLITEGPHADTQDLQLPVFRWFNRFLKGEDPIIDMAAKKFFTPQELRVFDQLPADQINTRIQESFVPAASRAGTTPTDAKSLQLELRTKVFGGWPSEPCPIAPALYAQSNQGGMHVRCYRFESQPGVELSLVLLADAKVKKPGKVIMKILDTESWTNSPCAVFPQGAISPDQLAGFHRQMQSEKAVLAFFAPRLVEPTSWSGDLKKFNQIRRRFMLLGQTLDGMRVWDIRCAVRALQSLPGTSAPVYAVAQGDMAVNAAYAALFEPAVSKLQLAQLPPTQAAGPDYLNVLKFVDLPQVMTLLGKRVELR